MGAAPDIVQDTPTPGTRYACSINKPNKRPRVPPLPGILSCYLLILIDFVTGFLFSMFSAFVGKNGLFRSFVFNMFSAFGCCAPRRHFVAMHFVEREAGQIASPNPSLLLPPRAEARAGMTLGATTERGIESCPAGRGSALGPANRLAEPAPSISLAL